MKKKLAGRFILIASLLFSLLSPASVYADPISGEVENVRGNSLSNGGFANDTKGGKGSADAHDEQAGRFMIYEQNCGYRIAIVDREGNAVANTIDLVNYAPYDLTLPNGGGPSLQFMENTGNGVNIYANFQKWKNTIGMDEGDKESEDGFQYSVGIKSEKYAEDRFTYGIATGLGWYPSSKYTKSGGGESPVNAYMYPIIEVERALWRAASKECEENGWTPRDFGAFHIPLPTVLADKSSSYNPGGVGLKQTLEQRIDLNNNPKSHIVMTTLLNMKLPDYNWRGEKRSDETRPAFQFIDGVEAKSKIGTKQSDGTEYTIITAMKEYGFKCVVEPVYWSVVPVMRSNGSGVDAIGGTTCVLYGTASCILKTMYDSIIAKDGFVAMNEEVSDFSAVGAGWPMATLTLGLTTLQVDHPDTEMGIGVSNLSGIPGMPAYYNLASTASGDSYKTNGYGCFIYDTEMLFGDPEGTHTWDSNTYPEESYEPGPAPEVPTEEQGTGKSKQNIIVKYYAHKTDSGYTYINNFNRDNTISPIDIEGHDHCA